jgi:hypothetical protein
MAQNRHSPADLFRIIMSGAEGLHPGKTYEHANGGRYVLIQVALREYDLEPLAIYASLEPEHLGYSITFVRPTSEFRERFTLEGEDTP